MRNRYSKFRGLAQQTLLISHNANRLDVREWNHRRQQAITDRDNSQEGLF